MALSFVRRAVLSLLLSLLAVVSLSGCGSSESEEREAFKEFLQKRIIAKRGLRVPKLTDQERGRLGQYAGQYGIISSYNDDLSSFMTPAMQDIAAVLRMSSPKSILEGRATLAEVRTKAKASRERFEARLEKARAEHAALKQPDDLKPVFDEAYRRTVTEPAALLADLLTVTDQAMGSYDALASFLDKNKQAIKLSGMTVEVSDQKLLDKFNALVAEIRGVATRLQQAQSKLRALI